MENFQAVVAVTVGIAELLPVASREIAADPEMGQAVEPVGCNQLPAQESRSQTDRTLGSAVIRIRWVVDR